VLPMLNQNLKLMQNPNPIAKLMLTLMLMHLLSQQHIHMAMENTLDIMV